MPKYKLFQPVKTPPNRHSFAAKLAVAAEVGMIVNRKSGATDEVELSTGKAGYFLRTKVVADNAALKAFIEADELRPHKAGFETPQIAGGHVQVEDFEEVWVEGSGLLHASMDADTVVGQPVTTDSGKLKELTNSETEECLGFVQLNEVGKVDTDNRRFLIRVARSAKSVIP